MTDFNLNHSNLSQGKVRMMLTGWLLAGWLSGTDAQDCIPEEGTTVLLGKTENIREGKKALREREARKSAGNSAPAVDRLGEGPAFVPPIFSSAPTFKQSVALSVRYK